MAKDYAQVFVKQGMVVDLSVHDKGDGNPHAHYLLTMRDINEDGFSKKKNGNWDRNDYVIAWRKSYEDITNRYLDMNGFDAKICVDSYEKQGVDRIPTIHLGSAAHQMEQRGIETDRGNINRDIQKVNREIEEINREIGLLKQEAEYVKSLEGASGYSVEKEPVKIFHHGRAAEHSREYNIQDAAIAPHYMGAEEGQVEVEEPLSNIPVEDLIEHYNRAFEDVKKTAETVGIILTEKGKQSLAIQQKNIENALEQLKQQQEEKLKGQLTRGGEYLADQQRSVDEAIERLKPSAPEWEAPDRPSPVGEPEPQRQPGLDELYEVPDGYVPPQPEQQATPETEESTAPSPAGEPGPQRRPDFDELYEVPDMQPRHPAPPHTAAENSQERHRASEGQTKIPQQHKYDALYETPEDWYIRKAKEQETPFHHAPMRKTERQSKYDDLYREPGGGNTNQRSHHPDPDDPDPKK